MIHHHLEHNTLRTGTHKSHGSSEREVNHKEKSASCDNPKQGK